MWDLLPLKLADEAPLDEVLRSLDLQHELLIWALALNSPPDQAYPIHNSSPAAAQ